VAIGRPWPPVRHDQWPAKQRRLVLCLRRWQRHRPPCAPALAPAVAAQTAAVVAAIAAIAAIAATECAARSARYALLGFAGWRWVQ
jgi:hypothetical protein